MARKGQFYGKYGAIHMWLRKYYGPASRCENPECPGKSTRYDWAKNPGVPYTHDRESFKMLCHSCHFKQDMTLEWHRKSRETIRARPQTEAEKRRGRERGEHLRAIFSRPVEQIDAVSGAVIHLWPSMKAAGNAVGIHQSCISRAVKYERITAGYKWRA